MAGGHVGGPPSAGAGGWCWGLLLPCADWPPPTAPEEDELQRHAPGHRGPAPGEAEGPEDALHRAQRQRQEHERVCEGQVAGGGRHVGWEAAPLCSLTPALSLQEHHHQVTPASLPAPSPTLILNKVPSLFFPPWSWCRFQGQTWEERQAVLGEASAPPPSGHGQLCDLSQVTALL